MYQLPRQTGQGISEPVRQLNFPIPGIDPAAPLPAKIVHTRKPQQTSATTLHIPDACETETVGRPDPQRISGNGRDRDSVDNTQDKPRTKNSGIETLVDQENQESVNAPELSEIEPIVEADHEPGEGT